MNDPLEISTVANSNITAVQKNEQRHFVFRPISIQYRLPLVSIKK